MIYKTIDLYDYYGLKKNGDLQGFLHIYALDNNKEINLNRAYPAMLIIPGGGYEFVSFREMEPVAIKLINEGIQSFVLEYSCGESIKYPCQLIEAYLALKYIQDNVEIYNIRKDRIGAMGFSAGGHLCGLISNLFNSDCLKLYGVDGDIQRPYLDCFIYPVVSSNFKIAHIPSFKSLTRGEDELIEKLSVDKMIDDNSPRAFIFTTRTDSVVSCSNSILLANKLIEHNINCELHMFSKGEHGMSLGNKSVFNTKFLDDIIKNNSKWFELMISYFDLNDFVIED